MRDVSRHFLVPYKNQFRNYNSWKSCISKYINVMGLEI